MADPNRPTPPENLDGEQLLEWHRVCDEMEAAGCLDKKCRALLTLYVQSWAIAHECNKYVVQLGPIIRCFGQPRPSPFYKVWREATSTCNSLLVNLGLTASKGTGEKKESEELEI